jgi:hypothetical protein
MSQPQEVPLYELTQRAFFEPDLLEVGTVVEYEGPPGPHLRPLNDAAIAALQSWAKEEVELLDPFTGRPNGVKGPSPLRAGPILSAPGVQHKVVIRKEPSDRPAEVVQSMAEIAAAKKPTNIRPAPSGTVYKVGAPASPIPQKEAK